MSKGLRIPRRYTTEGADPYAAITWSTRDSRITNPDGSVVFEVLDAEVPSTWSQVATDIIVSKYFRKAGVPVLNADGSPVLDENRQQVTGAETSARQVFDRLATTWRWWGENHGYFASADDAQAFEDELKFMLANQIASPNSPQWFNTGLAHAYGITGTPQGFWYVDPDTEELRPSPDSYSRPAPHACFPAGTLITTDNAKTNIEDVRVGDLVLTHLGRLRPVTEVMQRNVNEPLVRLESESFNLVTTANHPIRVSREIGNIWKNASDVVNGDMVVTGDGSTREILLTDRQQFAGTVYNFQVEEDESYVANGVVVHNCFINGVNDDLVNPGGIMDLWVREARLFKMGSGTGSNFSQIRAENEQLSGGGKSSGVMGFLRIGDRAAGAIKSGGTTRRAAKMVILDLDHPDIEEFIDWKKHEEEKARILINYGGYPADFNGEAYATVSGQNSNNSVRVPNEFIEAVRNDGDWHLTERTSGKVRKTVKARDLWRKVAEAAWACADPGVQFDTIINEWHTSPAGGKIRATNPCSEYVFIDNTACNLASINLIKFYDQEKSTFDIEGYEHAIRLWTMVLEISVTMAQFPSKEIAQGSYEYRTLGLGYANLGSLLMQMGIPYDSQKGRAIAGAITAILTGYSYATSAELAAAVGPFPKFAANREAMLRVIRNHRRATHNTNQNEYEGLSHHVMGIDPGYVEGYLLNAARQSWDLALDLGERHGYRNAQVSVTAPTGTIGLQMDCDTTGVEPDFSLVKFKKLAGGGYFKIVNQSVTPALRKLGYDETQITDIIRYIVGTSSLEGAPHINRDSLIDKGFTDEDLVKIEQTLSAVFELRHAFNPFVLGEATLQRLGFEADEYATFEFDLLRALGFSAREIREATEWVCGQQTIEGAPHLKDEHLAVFDTANRNGRNGQRLIHHTGHIKMLAATQPFLSGAASKTINMPNEATIQDIEDSYLMSFQLGVKCLAIYRDGSKASQPLSSGSDDAQPEDEPEEITRAHEIDKQILWGKIPAGLSPTQAYARGMHPPRFLLPGRRAGYTQEARIGGHKVYLRTGEYEDGTLGEVFIDLAKEGATLRGVLSCFAIAVSKGLQFGVPLEEFVDTFTFQTFEPRGLVEGHPNIKMANSIVDYVFRALAVEYLKRDELAQVPPVRDGELPEPAKGMAVDAGIQLDIGDAVAEQDVSAISSAVSYLKDNQPPTQTKPAQVKTVAPASSHDAGTAAMQSALSSMMGDAPICDVCGHITVRNGSCYKCLNCGNSLGCS